MYRLIDKVLSGKATPEEKQELESWVAAHPNHRDDYEDLKLLWKYCQARANPQISDPRYYNGLDRNKEIVCDKKDERKRDISYRIYLVIIVSLVISLISLIIFAYYNLTISSRTTNSKKIIRIESNMVDKCYSTFVPGVIRD